MQYFVLLDEHCLRFLDDTQDEDIAVEVDVEVEQDVPPHQLQAMPAGQDEALALLMALNVSPCSAAIINNKTAHAACLVTLSPPFPTSTKYGLGGDVVHGGVDKGSSCASIVSTRTTSLVSLQGLLVLTTSTTA